MQKKPCVGNDPFCPCQDGDSCHYEGNDPFPVPLIKQGSRKSKSK